MELRRRVGPGAIPATPEGIAPLSPKAPRRREASPGVEPPLPKSASRQSAISGPYAALAKGGDFSRTVLTPSGEVFVTVRVAKENPGQERPLVYLDGIAARRSRSDMMAEKLRDEGGRTVIAILLKGQGETLLRDLEKTKGESIEKDVTDAEQAKVVIEVLDALQVKAPVDIFGLSYGGAIAAATARDAGERVAELLLVAPHVRSHARDYMGEAAWKLATSPWNPWGNTMYRAAAKATLSSTFGVSDLFKEHPAAFTEALFRLSMGIDQNELAKTTQGLKNVNILVAAKDSASPLVHNQSAVEAAAEGKLTLAPEALAEQHDLVSADPGLIVRWVTERLNPERLPRLPSPA